MGSIGRKLSGLASKLKSAKSKMACEIALVSSLAVAGIATPIVAYNRIDTEAEKLESNIADVATSIKEKRFGDARSGLESAAELYNSNTNVPFIYDKNEYSKQIDYLKENLEYKIDETSVQIIKVIRGLEGCCQNTCTKAKHIEEVAINFAENVKIDEEFMKAMRELSFKKLKCAMKSSEHKEPLDRFIDTLDYLKKINIPVKDHEPVHWMPLYGFEYKKFTDEIDRDILNHLKTFSPRLLPENFWTVDGGYVLKFTVFAQEYEKVTDEFSDVIKVYSKIMHHFNEVDEKWTGADYDVPVNQVVLIGTKLGEVSIDRFTSMVGGYVKNGGKYCDEDMSEKRINAFADVRNWMLASLENELVRMTADEDKKEKIFSEFNNLKTAIINWDDQSREDKTGLEELEVIYSSFKASYDFTAFNRYHKLSKAYVDSDERHDVDLFRDGVSSLDARYRSYGDSVHAEPEKLKRMREMLNTYYIALGINPDAPKKDL